MQTVVEVFKKITAVAKAEKKEVYVVGGYVRDILLGKSDQKDIDCVVVGSGLLFAKAFDKAMKESGSLVGFPDFDTARYIIELTPPLSSSLLCEGERGETLASTEERAGRGLVVFEFAGARAESYDAKSRKPKVEVAALDQDLARRDFTVNAMALPVEILTKKISAVSLKKNLIDKFGGG